jgi:hypothetical protein
MAEKDWEITWVTVNRAPVLTLWAAVVAEVLRFEYDEALTLGGRWRGRTPTPRGFPWGYSSRLPEV